MVALSREDAFASAVNLFSHIDFLKDQKKECIDALLEKKDVLGVLPRGIEKSLIYLLFPKIHLLVNSGEMCHVVVVSALKAIAITEEQVVELNEWEFQLQRLARCPKIHDKILEGKYEVVFGRQKCGRGRIGFQSLRLQN